MRGVTDVGFNIKVLCLKQESNGKVYVRGGKKSNEIGASDRRCRTQLSGAERKDRDQHKWVTPRPSVTLPSPTLQSYKKGVTEGTLWWTRRQREPMQRNEGYSVGRESGEERQNFWYGREVPRKHRRDDNGGPDNVVEDIKEMWGGWENYIWETSRQDLIGFRSLPR